MSSSLHQGRINKISEKLNGLSLKLSRDRVVKADFVENRYKSLENKFLSFRENSQQK